jgi:hypothetical protein
MFIGCAGDNQDIAFAGSGFQMPDVAQMNQIKDTMCQHDASTGRAGACSDFGKLIKCLYLVTRLRTHECRQGSYIGYGSQGHILDIVRLPACPSCFKYRFKLREVSPLCLYLSGRQRKIDTKQTTQNHKTLQIAKFL